MSTSLLDEVQSAVYAELEKLETKTPKVLCISDIELALNSDVVGKDSIIGGLDIMNNVKNTKFDVIIVALLKQESFRGEKDVDTHLKKDGTIVIVQPTAMSILKQLPYVKLKTASIRMDGQHYSVEVAKKSHVIGEAKTPKSKAKITVIIPCYNYGRYLPESVDSVLAQTRMPDQIILSDDASTDNSASIMQAYQEAHPELIELNLNAENQGIEKHFNGVIKKATGDFICFLGADNRMPPHYIDSLAQALEQNKDVAVAYTDFAFFGNRSKIIFDKFKDEFKGVYLGYDVYTTDFPEYSKKSKKFIDEGTNFIHGSSMFRKEAFDDVGGYDSREGGAEDKVLFRKMLNAGWLAQKVGGVYLEYRQHSNEQANLQFSYFSELKFLRGENEKQRARITQLTEDRERLNARLSDFDALVKQMQEHITQLEVSTAHRMRKLAGRSVRGSRAVLGKVKRKAIALAKRSLSQSDEGSDQALFRNYILPIYHPSNFSSSRINVTLVVHRTGRPTSSAFIRLISPLTHPSVSDRIGLEITDPSDLLIKKGTDVCIVQRTAIPSVREARKLAATLKRRNIKLIIDNDDAFCHLTVAHPEYAQQKEKIKAMDFLMEEADEVWVSTKELQSEYAQRGEVVVVRNTLDERVWPNLQNEKYRPLDADEPLRLIYMGTVTHSADFALVKPIFDKLHKKHPGEFTLTVVGVANSFTQSPWIDVQSPYHPIYPEFTKWFSALGPFDIGISPLEDTPFNRSKSDIKCLDYLANGARPVVSDIEAYDNPELNTLITRVSNDEKEWFKVLEVEVKQRAKKRSEAEQQAMSGYHYIKKERSAQDAAKLVLKRLEGLEAED